MNTKHLHKRANLLHSEIIEKIPAACANELRAVEFLEEQRWGESVYCPHCGSVDVYKMTDKKTGARNKRFLWLCRDCKDQYTVRTGSVYAESRIPLRHWCYAFWAACSSKKGISALQIKRMTGISYKSALFMMHRIRFAMAPANEMDPKLSGTVEVDELYVGGKPRKAHLYHPAPKRKPKSIVFGAVERGGNIRRHVVANVTGETLKRILKKNVDKSARIHTDELPVYRGVCKEFKGGHETVCHSDGEYARKDVTTNTIESSFALLRRGLIGTFHAVSKEHLHRYVAEFDFRWNYRKVNDGDRLVACIQAAQGKRLTYEEVTH